MDESDDQTEKKTPLDLPIDRENWSKWNTLKILKTTL